MKGGNNFAFIDSQNLYRAVQQQGWRLDFARLKIFLADKYFVTRAYLFIGDTGNERLYEHLRQDGYILIFKPSVRDRITGRNKGNIDAELVLHAVAHMHEYDKAVVITGDGDFLCLIEYLLLHDKLARLLIPDRRHFSSLFRTLIEHAAFISDVREKVEIKMKGITAGQNLLDSPS